MVRELTLLLIMLQIGNAVFVHKEIDSNQHFCLHDDIPRHTLIKIDVKTEGHFKFEFKEGMIPVFTTNLDRSGLTKSITTQRYGIHHFCFLNLGERTSKVALQISIGSRANDYGSLQGGDELVQALVNQGKIAEQFIQEIVRQNSEGMEIMIHESRQTHNFGQYFLFTLLFGVASIGLTYMQYRVITRHLHSRKYI